MSIILIMLFGLLGLELKNIWINEVIKYPIAFSLFKCALLTSLILVIMALWILFPNNKMFKFLNFSSIYKTFKLITLKKEEDDFSYKKATRKTI